MIISVPDIIVVEKIHRLGEAYCKKKQFREAIAAYSKAIDMTESMRIISGDRIMPLYMVVLYDDRAKAYVEIGETDKAVMDCQIAIELDPQFLKVKSNMQLRYFLY